MDHEQYIQRCLQLAEKGIGTTRPNPSVGAVVVVDEKIIGEGFTSPYGGSHAEVNAINSVEDTALLKRATLYVTLEPCSHFGKTPPCTDLIIEKEIPKVVIGCVDSNSLVSGRGIKRLKESGVHIITGVLENECKEHHRRFFTFHNKRRPYIILKWAQSKDGFIAPYNRDKRKPVWITNIVSRQLVHRWRAEEHGIFVGTKTVLDDNPSLNVRTVKGENPIRMVIDRELKIPSDSNVYDGTVKTFFFTKRESKDNGNIIYESVDFSKPIAKQICDIAHRQNIQSMIIEGGTKTIETFINEDLWDEARVFEGDLVFKEGVKAPILNKKEKEQIRIKTDLLNIYRND